MAKSVIIGVHKETEDGKPVVFAPPTERVVGRQIVGWSMFCGTTHGNLSPGFFGLHLAASKPFTAEWLILRLSAAYDWLSVNGSAESSRFVLLKDKSTAKAITKFEVFELSFELEIGEIKITLTEDPTNRPLYAGSDQLRVLSPGDDLRTAWIIASGQRVWVLEKEK
jgi:hypothetical protein